MKYELTDIVSPKFLQEIQESLSYATGLGVVFVDRHGRHMGEGSNFCQLCQAINKHHHGFVACEESNFHAIEKAIETGESEIYLCHAGLASFAVPLMYRGQCLGAITAGQVFCSESSAYPQYATAPVDWSQDPQLRQYYNEIQHMNPKQIHASVQAFQNISKYIMQTIEYNDTQQLLRKAEQEQLQLQHLLQAAELDALQKQVTPHFIFNVLSTISRLMDRKEYGVSQEMLQSFIQMLRYTLYNHRMTVTLGEELEYANNYLNIQKIRFGDRVRYRICCPEELKQREIPFFSLQPLVENALQHGLIPTQSGGEILVDCRQTQEHWLQIQIQDNGIGIQTAKQTEILKMLRPDNTTPPPEHVGLYNCYRRFLIMYGDRFHFSIQSSPGNGTLVKIVLTQ